jgi:hypothetical protein
MPIKPTRWNPADQSANVVIRWDRLTVTVYGSRGFARSVDAISTGKMYVEFDRDNGNTMPGIASAASATSTYIGQTNESIGLFNGDVYRNSGVVASAGLGVGVIGMAIDATARTVEFRTNSFTTGAVSIPWAGAIYLAGGNDAGSFGNVKLNAGQSSFSWTVPSGFTAGFGQVLNLSFSGTVLDETGTPAARTVRAYRRSTGELVGEATSDGSTGAYQIYTPFNEYHTLEFLNDDSALNALVYDWVMPV